VANQGIRFVEHINPVNNASILQQLTTAISQLKLKKPSNPTIFVATGFSVKSVETSQKRIEPRRFIQASYKWFVKQQQQI
jgi:hypothetical protein